MKSFVCERVDVLSTQQQGDQDSFIRLAGSLDQNIEAVKTKTSSHLNEMSSKISAKFDEINEKATQHPEVVSLMKTAIQEHEKEHAILLAGLMDSLKILMGDFVQVTNNYLEKQAIENSRLKEEAEEHSQRMSEFDEQIMSLIHKKKESLIQHTDHVQRHAASRVSDMASFQKELKSKDTEIPKTCGDAAEKINRFVKEKSQAHLESLDKTCMAFTNIQQGCHELSVLTRGYVSESQEHCNQSTEALRKDVNEMCDDSASRFAGSQEMIQFLASKYDKMNSSLCNVVKESHVSMTSSLEHQSDLYKDHDSVVSSAITRQSKQLNDTVQMFTNLFDDELKKDVPTGRTPQRTVFSYPRSLTKTRQHQKLLEQFRISQQQEAAELAIVAEQEVKTESSTVDHKGSLDNLSDAGSVAALSVASTSGISVSTSISKFSELDEPKENESNVKKAPSSIKKMKPKTPARTFKKPTTARARLPLKPSN